MLPSTAAHSLLVSSRLGRGSIIVVPSAGLPPHRQAGPSRRGARSRAHSRGRVGRRESWWSPRLRALIPPPWGRLPGFRCVPCTLAGQVLAWFSWVSLGPPCKLRSSLACKSTDCNRVAKATQLHQRLRSGFLRGCPRFLHRPSPRSEGCPLGVLPGARGARLPRLLRLALGLSVALDARIGSRGVAPSRIRHGLGSLELLTVEPSRKLGARYPLRRELPEGSARFFDPTAPLLFAQAQGATCHGIPGGGEVGRSRGLVILSLEGNSIWRQTHIGIDVTLNPRRGDPLRRGQARSFVLSTDGAQVQRRNRRGPESRAELVNVHEQGP